MTTIRKAIIGAAAILLIAGCKNNVNNNNSYKAAIDAYYDQSPSCLWSHPQQFPMQVAAFDTGETGPLAALVDEGLLSGSTTENTTENRNEKRSDKRDEKRNASTPTRETSYDLTNKGRGNWIADPSQPGYGNFCYGHRSVHSLVSSTPNNGHPGATTTVTYRYRFTNVPAWAMDPELQGAAPRMKADISSEGTATATLTDTPTGWRVQGAPPPDATGINNSPSATSSDGKIVR